MSKPDNMIVIDKWEDNNMGGDEEIYQEIYTIEEFVEAVENGWLIDYDGFGEYRKNSITHNQIVYPSDVINGLLDRNYTHVVWYNK